MMMAMVGLGQIAVGASSAVEVTESSARYQLQIQRTRLNDALEELGEQTSLQIAIFSDVGPTNIVVGPLVGTYTPEEALAVLLSGTGLTYRFVNDRTIAIIKRALRPVNPAEATSPSADRNSSASKSDSGDQNSNVQEPGKMTATEGRGKHRKFLSRLLGMFALCGAVALPTSPVCAQSAQQQPGDTADAAANSGQLEEVVVTAQKRAEDIERTPIAITAVSGDELRKEARNSIEQQLEMIPGVRMQGGSLNFATIFIRGIGPVVPGVDTNTAVNNDGIYQSTLGTSAQLDIARIEVLKGPQGTLYGRNSTAGTVNVITNDPTSQFGGFASVQGGNYSEFRTEDVVNVPVTASLLTRTALLYEGHDGYLSNGTDDEATYAAREKILLKPTDNLAVLVSAEYNHFGGHGSGVVRAPLPSDPWATSDVPGYQKTSKQQYYARVDWDLGFGVVTYEPSYYYQRLRSDDVVIPVPVGPALTANNNKQQTHELRIASEADSKVQWQAGVYYLNLDTQTLPLWCCLINQEPNGATVTAQEQKTLSEAAFGQVTYPFSSTFRATAGIRYSEDKKSVGPQYTYGGTSGQLLSLNEAAALDKNFPATTWKLGIESDLTPTSLFYADIAKGYKSGGFNAVGVQPTSYGPEQLIAYELGSKSRLLNNTWQVNGDAYYYDYSDIQSNNTTGQLSANGLPVFAVENAGKARVYGAELDVSGLITPRDRVNLTSAYNDARYVHFEYHSTGFAPPPAYTISFNDRQLPLAPLWTHMLGYEHSVLLSNSASIAVGGDIQFVSSSDTTIDPVPNERQPSYHLIDLRAVFKSPSAAWNLTLYCNNLGNVAVRQAWAGISPVFPASEFIGPPRTYGATLTYDFGTPNRPGE